MELKKAMEIADLWRSGKMIGHDEHEVAVPLLEEIERIREAVFPIMTEMKAEVERRIMLRHHSSANFVDFPFSELAEIFPDLFITDEDSRFSIAVQKRHKQ